MARIFVDKKIWVDLEDAFSIESDDALKIINNTKE